MDYTNLSFKQRKQLQDFPLREALEQLIKVSHKHIPNNSRICRLDIVLDVPGRTRSIILDFSPLHFTYVIRDPEIKLSLMKDENL